MVDRGFIGSLVVTTLVKLGPGRFYISNSESFMYIC